MRPIDADRLKRVLIAFFTGAHLELPHISKVIDFLDNAPTIDAEPVVHGRWIKRYEGLFDCSSCGVRMDLEGTPEEYLMHYCPYCGAKMDEVSE